MKLLLFLVYFLVIVEMYLTPANRVSFDLFESLDKARDALLSFYDPVVEPTLLHSLAIYKKIQAVKTRLFGNRFSNTTLNRWVSTAQKQATDGASLIGKSFATMKTLSSNIMKPFKPIWNLFSTYVAPVPKKITTSFFYSTNKFLQALDDIEKALTDAQFQNVPRTTAHNEVRLTRLQNLIKTAVSKRSYRYARKAIGEALFTIMKLKETGGTGRIRQDDIQFLKNVRKTIGAQAFADLLAMQGQVTLIFAIDTTASMGNEIDASKKIVQSIVNQHRIESVDYILSPFNDPVNGKLKYFNTSQNNSFVQALQNINVYGGGDCPELTFKGMMDAINVGQPFPNSPMYVFTDAGAKDASENNIIQLIQLAKAQRIVINFFVAHSSCTLKKSDMSPFEKVAQATTGQVFRLKDANELKQLAGLTGISLGGTAVISTANNNIINYRRKRSNSKQVKRYKIPVDDSIDTLVISVTMDKPKTTTSFWDVSLTTPSGKITRVTEKLQKNVIYQLSNPTVGDWVLQITTDNSVKYEFYAKASSANNIDFEYYFVKKNRSLLVPISSPVKGQQAQVILTVGGAGIIDKTSLQAEVVTTTGRTTNQAISITNEDTHGVRHLLTFTPPGNIFKIKLKGKTNKGNYFERISHNFIHSETILIKVLYVKNDYTVSAGNSTYIMFMVENQGDSESVELAAFGSLGLIESISLKAIVIRKGRRTSFTVNFKADSNAEKGITITIVASVKGKNSGSKATTSVPLLVV